MYITTTLHAIDIKYLKSQYREINENRRRIRSRVVFTLV